MPTVKIISDTRIEAHAYPNGVCFLSTGMLDVLENESQLAMILAHEMVHYARQHTAALYNHFQPTNLQYDSREADGVDPVDGMTILHAIDSAERQADREGVAIIQAAGYCDKEVLPLMANLVRCMVEQGHPESVPQLNKRIERFNALVNQEGQGRAGSEPTGTDANGYRDGVAPALIDNAELALRGGDWSQAERSITRFLESEPLNARAYYLKGEILRRQNGNRPNAACIGAYEKALEIDPTFQPPHRALGELYFKAGRCQMAKPYFEAFLNLAPKDAASSFIKGYLKQCQK
jgi:predicted Zn-dependent protease